MPVTPTEFRKNIYQMLDDLIETGEPIELTRNGRKIEIAMDEAPRMSRLDRLQSLPDYPDDPRADEPGYYDLTPLWYDEWLRKWDESLKADEDFAKSKDDAA